MVLKYLISSIKVYQYVLFQYNCTAVTWKLIELVLSLSNNSALSTYISPVSSIPNVPVSLLSSHMRSYCTFESWSLFQIDIPYYSLFACFRINSMILYQLARKITSFGLKVVIWRTLVADGWFSYMSAVKNEFSNSKGESIKSSTSMCTRAVPTVKGNAPKYYNIMNQLSQIESCWNDQA